MRHLFVLKNYATVDFSAMLAAEKMDDIKVSLKYDLRNVDLLIFVVYNEKEVTSFKYYKVGHLKCWINSQAIHKMMSEGICRGYVRPLSRVTFEPHEAAGAFRLLSLSQHRGRVLLRMKDNMLDAQHR